MPSAPTAAASQTRKIIPINRSSRLVTVSTAAFFKFIEANYCKDAIDIMHNALRNQTFTLDTFKEQMGTSLDDLWDAYMKAAEQ